MTDDRLNSDHRHPRMLKTATLFVVELGVQGSGGELKDPFFHLRV